MKDWFAKDSWGELVDFYMISSRGGDSKFNYFPTIGRMCETDNKNLNDNLSLVHKAGSPPIIGLLPYLNFAGSPL